MGQVHDVSSLPAPPPEPSPHDLERAIARLTTSFDTYSEKADDRFRELHNDILAIGDKARRAEEMAANALRTASDVKNESNETRDAMIRHAASVTETASSVKKASDAVVLSNAQQTPAILNTQALVVAIKRWVPVVVIVFTAMGTAIGALVQAYYAARGH
jgi:methyl-accepting chemotaxis protein